jgi:acetyl esterase/lipase
MNGQQKDILLDASQLSFAAGLYAGGEMLSHPYISPLYGDFKGLPPLFIQVTNEEILLSDALRVFDKVKKAKGDVTLEIWEDMFHAWPYAAPFLKEGKEALIHVKQFIVKQTQRNRHKRTSPSP